MQLQDAKKEQEVACTSSGASASQDQAATLPGAASASAASTSTAVNIGAVRAAATPASPAAAQPQQQPQQQHRQQQTQEQRQQQQQQQQPAVHPAAQQQQQRPAGVRPHRGGNAGQPHAMNGHMVMAPMPYGMWPAYAGVPIWSDNGLLVGPGAYPVSLVAPMGPVMWPPHVLVSPRHAMGGQHQHGKNGGGRARGGRSRGGHARSHSNASSSVHDSISSLGEANASSPQSARGGDGASSAAGSTRGAAGKAAAAAAASAAGSPGGAASTSSEAGSGALSRTASGSTAVPSSDRQGWAWLVEGVLEKVVARLARGGCSATGVQSFRLTCRHWRRVADGAIDSLSPGALRPKELVTLFPRLQVLELMHCPNVRNRDLYVLAQSPLLQLRALAIGDDTNKPWVTNRGLASIGRMSSLAVLALHDCNSITNNGLTSLAVLNQLVALSLRGCRKITNNGLEVLQAHSSITSLNLAGCKRISDKGLAALAKLPLKALALGLTRVKDEGLSYLAQLTSLTELHCTGEEVTGAGLSHLRALTGLQTLVLRDCCEGAGPGSLPGLLPALPHLRHLNLHKWWEFNDEQLMQSVVHMLGLRSLDLRGTNVTAIGLAELTQLSTLRRLALAPQPDVRADSLAVVSTLTQLGMLMLCSCPPTEPVLRAVGSMTGLQELSLCYDAPPEEGVAQEPLPNSMVEAVAGMTHLRVLDLSRRSVTEQQLQLLLHGLTQLASLSLYGCGLDPAVVARVERSFPRVQLYTRMLVAGPSVRAAARLDLPPSSGGGPGDGASSSGSRRRSSSGCSSASSNSHGAEGCDAARSAADTASCDDCSSGIVGVGAVVGDVYGGCGSGPGDGWGLR